MDKDNTPQQDPHTGASNNTSMGAKPTYTVTSTGVSGGEATFVHSTNSEQFMRDARESCARKVKALVDAGHDISLVDANGGGDPVVYKLDVYEHDGGVITIGMFGSLEAAKESGFNYMKWFYSGRVPELSVGVDELISGLRAEGFVEHYGAVLQVRDFNHGERKQVVTGNAYIMVVGTDCVTLGGEFSQCYVIEQVPVMQSALTSFF